MAGPVTDGWLAVQLEGAPAELVERTREFLAAAGGPVTAASLARAGKAALDAAAAADPDRGAALNLLAADALVTLALAARAEEAPDDLERFAAALRNGGAS
jgi:hypothetical protein